MIIVIKNGVILLSIVIKWLNFRNSVVKIKVINMSVFS